MSLAFPKPISPLKEERRRIKAQSESDRSRLEAEADRLCGELVKRLAKHRCEAKGYGGHRCSRTLDWCHGIPRTKQGTRWAWANTFSLCRTMHSYFHLNEYEFERWRIEKVGAATLDRMAEQARPVWRGDLVAIVAALKRGRFLQGER